MLASLTEQNLGDLNQATRFQIATHFQFAFSLLMALWIFSTLTDRTLLFVSIWHLFQRVYRVWYGCFYLSFPRKLLPLFIGHAFPGLQEVSSFLKTDLKKV